MSEERAYPIRVGIQLQQQHATYKQIGRAWREVACSAQLFADRGQLENLDELLDAGITHGIGDACRSGHDLARLATLIAWRDSRR